jgi:hypothetical protein
VKEREPIAEKAFALAAMKRLHQSFYSSEPLPCSTKESPGEDDPSPGKCSQSQSRRLREATEEISPTFFGFDHPGIEDSEELRQSMRKLLDLDTGQNLDNLEYFVMFFRWDMICITVAVFVKASWQELNTNDALSHAFQS